MSKFSEFIKGQKEKHLNFFFKGGWKKWSNKYLTFTHFVDEDNIIIVTKNVKIIKDSYCLIVDKNKAVFLKDWQVEPIKNYWLGQNAYAVSLNRNFFKTYTFKNDFEGFNFEKEDTFDNLLNVAKEQDVVNQDWALGWF